MSGSSQGGTKKERRKARVIASNDLRSRKIQTTVVKGKIRTADDTGAHDVEIPSGNVKRRAVQDSTDAPEPGHVRRESTVAGEKLEYDLTVRGSCHWAGVKKDWKWEGESCCRRLCQMFAEQFQCFLDTIHNTTLRAVLDDRSQFIYAFTTAVMLLSDLNLSHKECFLNKMNSGVRRLVATFGHAQDACGQSVSCNMVIGNCKGSGAYQSLFFMQG